VTENQERIGVRPLDQLARVVEALLFLSSEPVGLSELSDACEEPVDAVERALADLGEQYADGVRGLIIRQVAGGFTLASDPIAESAARRLLAKPRLAALTPAQLESLAIVAYLQPVSRPEIARIRGVDADSPVASLLDRGLIEESGRSQFGAAVYRTTTLFLKLFGLQATDGLPDVTQWDASPEEMETLRDRLLRAGEARASGAPRDSGGGSDRAA
jgi:segregation and condensation protein B